jgi:ribosomal protein S18 acetylase RimI-like enzyme
MEVRPYIDDKLDQVVEILATAFLNNPLHLVVFGGAGAEQLQQHRTFFAIALEFLSGGTKVVATEDGRVVGFAHWISSPGCRPSSEALGSAAPRLVTELGDEIVSRIITWRRVWGEQDPKTPHSHFGPFAVHPNAQGRGFGRRLMEHYCELVDEAGEAGYLETERPENLAIYRKAGFEVAAEREVLGIPSWFMARAARGHAV